MRRAVLDPLGMTASTFDQEPAPHDATPHDAEGAPMPAYRHAALAAAGLRTTAEDLARFAVAIVTEALPAAMTRAAPATGGRYGVGLELRSIGAGAPGARGAMHEPVDGLAGHSGQNRGWRALVAAVPATGRGIAVLCDGEGGEPVRRAALAALLHAP
jgi:CubicO group peptidase (beta-lactamase class C family)